MADYEEGIKREVAEVKFLIHDLRVERFINDVIHYHVTLSTDLEIYGVDQALALHDEDLQELKAMAIQVRETLHSYNRSVKEFAPDKKVLAAGKAHTKAIFDICELILNPRWGRIDRVLSFLPEDARSVRSRSHYKNSVRWITSVRSRIKHFTANPEDRTSDQVFDLAEEIQSFTRNFVYGYVIEKSGARVEIQIDRMDSGLVKGNRYRLRRMFFNLVMNAVDAMSGRRVGELRIATHKSGAHVVLSVRDNGSGMGPDKIADLLAEKHSLDGELHSLGFVFVRQTVRDFEGDLEIESEPGKGTTITLRFPMGEGEVSMTADEAFQEELAALQDVDRVKPGLSATHQQELESGIELTPLRPLPPGEEAKRACGALILRDYRCSDAEYPGCIFAIAIKENGDVDFFSHRAYERLFTMSHEDLSPMFFEAVVRGRLEDDKDGDVALILKAPQNVREFFEFKDVDESHRSSELFVEMVRNEYVRTARKLLETGMPGTIPVHLTSTEKFFPSDEECKGEGPFPLATLAELSLSNAGAGTNGS